MERDRPLEPGLEVLAVGATPMTLSTLRRHLAVQGIRVDGATDLGAARAAFLRSGGHHALVFAPGITPGDARTMAFDLQAVDPDLPVLWFRASHGPRVPGVEEVHGLHPGSRAAAGRIVRFLVERRGIR